MTSLRTFQTEIDQIHHREVVKQRAATLGKEKEKDAKKLVAQVAEKIALQAEVAHAEQRSDEESAIKDEDIQVCCRLLWKASSGLC